MTTPAAPETESAFDWLTMPDAAARAHLHATAGEHLAPLRASIDAYLGHPRPLFSRLPVSYRHVPLPARMAILRLMSKRPTPAADVFPAWPIERTIDDAIRDGWREAVGRAGLALREPSYDGRRAAIVITHDVDSAPELRGIEPLRVLERRYGLPSTFGFVPKASWPAERQVRDLIDEGCEAYWHDIAHDGRLPWLGASAMRAAFDRVAAASPWAVETMRAFRSGQMLMSRSLLEVVAERFDVDLSIPDSERFGPYGSSAGCGTVFPFRTRGILEIPLSLPQDAYLWNVHRLEPPEVVALWIGKLDYVISRGGVAVLNVHPVWTNPGHATMWRAYETFLSHVATTAELLATTPVRLAALIGRGDDVPTVGDAAR